MSASVRDLGLVIDATRDVTSHIKCDQVLLLQPQVTGKTGPFWLKMRQMPLQCLSSRPGWTIVTALCGAFQLFSWITYKISRMLLHVLWPVESLRNTLPLSCGHCTGSLSPNRLSTKSPCLTYQSLHKTTPQYLPKPVSQCNPPCFLRSPSPCRLSISGFGENTSEKRLGARSFRNFAPTVWNRLPDKLHRAKNIASFRRQLKSHLFSTLWSLHPPPLFPFTVSSFPYCPPSPPPPFPSPLPSATSMGFSCLESDCTLQVDVKMDIDTIQTKRGRGSSSVGRASDRNATDTGSIPRCGKGFFFLRSQLSVQTLLRCPYTPVCNRMH